MNQREFEKKDKHQKLRARLFAEAKGLGELGVKFDIPKVCEQIEHADLDNVGAASVPQILDSILLCEVK